MTIGFLTQCEEEFLQDRTQTKTTGSARAVDSQFSSNEFQLCIIMPNLMRLKKGNNFAL